MAKTDIGEAYVKIDNGDNYLANYFASEGGIVISDKDGIEKVVKVGNDTYKYDYDINAGNGKIKSHEKDKINCVKKTSSKYISVKKAKKIALNKAKFKASQVTFTKIKMDKKNGKKVYEIEFVKGKKEYDYTINAKTGKVMSVDIDVF